MPFVEDSCGSGPEGVAVSPDGTKIALGCGKRQIEIISTDGHDWSWQSFAYGQTMAGCGSTSVPHGMAWSPDGTQLLFTADCNLMVTSDDGKIRGLTSDGYADCTYADINLGAICEVSNRGVGWLASDQILYRHLGPLPAESGFVSRNYTYYVMSLDETGQQQLDLGIPSGPFAVSPDGTRIAVGADDVLYLADLSGSETTELARGFDPGWGPLSIAWSSDGSGIAFTSGHKIYAVGVDGTNLRVVAEAEKGHNIGLVAWVQGSHSSGP